MKYISGIVRHFGEIVADAEQSILDSLTANLVSDEPSITNRFLQELQSSINRNDKIKGIQLLPYTLTSLGPNADESIVGADFLAVLNIDIPGISVSKGFLCQAKRSVRGFPITMKSRKNIAVGFTDPNQLLHLQQQVNKMLRFTPDSFVSIYSNEAFAFVPALSVHGLQYGHNPDQVYAKSTMLFFNEFLMCFIGDRQLGVRNVSELKERAEQTGSRYAFLVNVKPSS
ncbi:MAG: hypothetical protein ACQET3_07305 [Promethearchaeati archaeon]